MVSVLFRFQRHLEEGAAEVNKRKVSNENFLPFKEIKPVKEF